LQTFRADARDNAENTNMLKMYAFCRAQQVVHTMKRFFGR